MQEDVHFHGLRWHFVVYGFADIGGFGIQGCWVCAAGLRMVLVVLEVGVSGAGLFVPIETIPRNPQTLGARPATSLSFFKAKHAL